MTARIQGNKNVLVTGGAGYIGAHMTRLLLENGYQPIVLDNLSTGYREFVPAKAIFIKADLNNIKVVARVFDRYKFDSVMHFAGSIVVPESVTDPLKYYYNNVSAAVNLLNEVARHKVSRFVFSSTAAVYGDTRKMPLTEEAPANPTNPYAQTKLMIEQVLHDCAQAYGFKYMALRYFNVVGSHPRGDIGIKMDKPTHLVPNIMRVANQRKKFLEVFGDDYDTPDGTCIRDYIYIMDLCQGHLLALQALEKKADSAVVNLGSGSGYSVKEVVETARKLTGKTIKVQMKGRRDGDVPKIVASYAKALRLLKWQPQTSLADMLASAWQWEKNIAA